MKISAFEATGILRAMPAASTIEIRDRDSGGLVMCGTPHECQILCEHGNAEGVVNKHSPERLRYLKLTVTARTALARLRRAISCSGRTVAEACQLVSHFNVPGGGIVYSHIMKRTNTYDPAKRRGHLPTFEHLKVSDGNNFDGSAARGAAG